MYLGPRCRRSAEKQRKQLLLRLKTAVLATGLASVASGVSAAPLSEEAAEQLAEFSRTGEFERCLNIRRISSITALDDFHFLVRVGAGNYYLNALDHRCSGASRLGNRLQYNVNGGQLCRLQIITVVDNLSGIPGGACGLSDFERLERLPDDETDKGEN